MSSEPIDPVIADAVLRVVNRFGAPGLDQLEDAAAQSRVDAQRAVISLVEQPRDAGTSLDDDAPAVDVRRPAEDARTQRVDVSSRAQVRTEESVRLLAEWQAASGAVRLECETYWTGWAARAVTECETAPSDEDRRRLLAFYAVEQASRDQFFAHVDSTS